jgi:hypothetical protein
MKRSSASAESPPPQRRKAEPCYLDVLLLCVDTLGLIETALGCTLGYVCKPLHNIFREHVGKVVQKRAQLSAEQVEQGLAKSCVLRVSNFSDAALSDLSWCQGSPLLLLDDHNATLKLVLPHQVVHRRILQQQMLCFVRRNDYVAWLWLFHILENIAGLEAQIDNCHRHILSQFLWRLLVEMLLADSVIHFVDLMTVIIRRWGKYARITPHDSIYTFEFFNGKREPRFTVFPESTLMQVLQQERQGRPFKFRWITEIIEYKSILDCMRQAARTHAHYKLLDDLASCYEPYGI